MEKITAFTILAKMIKAYGETMFSADLRAVNFFINNKYLQLAYDTKTKKYAVYETLNITDLKWGINKTYQKCAKFKVKKLVKAVFAGDAELLDDKYVAVENLDEFIS